MMNCSHTKLTAASGTLWLCVCVHRGCYYQASSGVFFLLQDLLETANTRKEKKTIVEKSANTIAVAKHNKKSHPHTSAFIPLAACSAFIAEG